MNTEQIIKALECFRHRILVTKLAEKVTEDEITSIINAIIIIKELQAHNENLAKENKYLRERLAEEMEHKEDMVVVRTARSGGKTAQLNKVIHIKKDEIIADIVKKMQEKLKDTMLNEYDLICLSTNELDQIAKEILEGGDTE